MLGECIIVHTLMYAVYNVSGRQKPCSTIACHISKEEDVQESRRFLLEVLGAFETNGLFNYKDTKTKCRLYWCLQTGDTVSHVGIFDPAL